ncbi:hypothetical protein ATE47_04085 [Chryseobacterium sp. IHB B 17019]|uniref:hypothetical protein n=1 Tax=Chryseobacterium sp. IHB B 17019 TaxID=1721091 RepID=UPI000720F21F|nr:hypothetical protein [Chryseobacterium sp. IHB B 17019]ALR29749.1 hypothetical protein ATE47_04085 [Chryseobacterium sp. IHB B 17019]
MKKLLIASIVMLASLTACQNSNDEFVTTPVGTQKVADKTMAREGEEMTKEEQIAMVEALDAVKEAMVRGETTGRAIILCHTPWNTVMGHACVSNMGYTFNVSWDAHTYSPGGGQSIINYDDYGNYIYNWHTTLQPRCNC